MLKYLSIIQDELITVHSFLYYLSIFISVLFVQVKHITRISYFNKCTNAIYLRKPKKGKQN
ncbi:hypothetical protein ACJX0J_018358, partial [Zea mays]